MPRYCPRCAFDLLGDWISPTWRLTALARLHAKRRVTPEGCWRWTGRTRTSGAGRFQLGGVTYDPRAVALVVLLGESPENTATVSTSCGSPACFAPAHLRSGAPTLTAERRHALILDLEHGCPTPTAAQRYGVSTPYVKRLRAWVSLHAPDMDRARGLLLPEDVDPLLAHRAVLIAASKTRYTNGIRAQAGQR